MVRLIIVNRTDDYYDDRGHDYHNDHSNHNDQDFDDDHDDRDDEEGCFEKRQWCG